MTRICHRRRKTRSHATALAPFLKGLKGVAMKKTELSKEAMQEHALAYEDAIEQIADALAIPLIDAMAYRPELSYALDAFAARAVERKLAAIADAFDGCAQLASSGHAMNMTDAAHRAGIANGYRAAAQTLREILAIRERGEK